MRVLVTNDDGIKAPGLHALARVLVGQRHDVVVAAPATDHSGFGTAIGPLHETRQIRFQRAAVPGVDVDAFAVEGSPALAVLAARLGGFGRAPDIVVSGVNAGANTGRAVLHSGTVGAALTANGFGIPGIAVSHAVSNTYRWEGAAEFAAALVPWMIEQASALTVNVNVPSGDTWPVAGVHVARPDAGGAVQAAMIETEQGVLQLHLPGAPAPEPGTDSAVIAAGCVAITPLFALAVPEVVMEGALDRLSAVTSGYGRDAMVA